MAMGVELLEIRDFLAGIPPFDVLPADQLDRLPRALTIRYVRRGREFPPEDGGSALYVVRMGALEMRTEKDELVAKYGEGDLHDATRPSAALPGVRGFAVEDTLVYVLPADALADLRASYPAFARHFGRTLREKLRRALGSPEHARALGGGVLMTVEVGSLVARPPVATSPDATIQEAARTMTRERVSSLLVLDGGRVVGIVTDRDLRRRVVAEALPASRPVREIMTAPVRTLPPTAPAFDALLEMGRAGVRHVPVVSGDRVIGVVTTTDLVRWQTAHASYLVSDARRADGLAALQQTAARVPELQIQLVAAGATPRHLGLAVGAILDAITQRLVAIAESELGPPPVPFSWIACGSQARLEQTALSDQDNGLVIDDAYDEARHGGWFGALASAVNEGLDACGWALCPGGVMASNPVWRRTRRSWRDLFDGWIARPERKAIMNAGLFFDMRAIAGTGAEAVADVRAHVLRRVKGNEVFLAHVVQNAIQRAPPLGFFRGLVVERGGEHADALDLKAGGIMPIVELARAYAMAVGSDALGTVERLRAAAEGGALSRAGADDLEDALSFVSALRARSQADRLKRGLAPDNHVPPASLSALERAQLKAAFGAIRSHQESLARVYRARSFV